MRTILLLLTLPIQAALAQQPTFRDSLLDRFVGEWVLQGTIRGQSVTHDVSVQWVLAHQYLHIHEVSRELNADGAPSYVADVYVGWNAAEHEYACLWLDVYGSIEPESIGHGTRRGEEIAFVFREKSGDLFRTTFAAGPSPDVWTWRMDSETKAGSKPFARVTLTRKPPPVPTR